MRLYHQIRDILEKYSNYNTIHQKVQNARREIYSQNDLGLSSSYGYIPDNISDNPYGYGSYHQPFNPYGYGSYYQPSNVSSSGYPRSLGSDDYYDERYPATPIHGKSGVYQSSIEAGCVISAIQMLLRDQGIYHITDNEIAKEVEHSEETGASEENMPHTLWKFGRVRYKWTPKDSVDDLKEALNSGHSIASSIEKLYYITKHEIVIDKIGKDSSGHGPFVYIRDSRYYNPYKVTIDTWEKAWVDGNVVPD